MQRITDRPYVNLDVLFFEQSWLVHIAGKTGLVSFVSLPPSTHVRQSMPQGLEGRSSEFGPRFLLSVILRRVNESERDKIVLVLAWKMEIILLKCVFVVCIVATPTALKVFQIRNCCPWNCCPHKYHLTSQFINYH